MVCWLRLCASHAGGLGSIPGQGTRSHMLQLRVHMLQLKISRLRLEGKELPRTSGQLGADPAQGLKLISASQSV